MDFSEYKPNETIWDEDREDIRLIKRVIEYRLSEIDKRLILLYAEMKSYKEVGKALRVSTSTAYSKVKEVRNKIMEIIAQ